MVWKDRKRGNFWGRNDMNTFVLKLIACATMFIDHFTEIFIPQMGRLSHHAYGGISSVYLAGRLIGRIAFPIYCFLLVEGFFRTRDRRKYMARMAVFALISEFPFDLAFQVTGKQIRIRELFSYQNVMITLLLGLVLMYLYEWIKMKYLMQPLIFNTLGVMAIVGIGYAAQCLKTDYGMGGILLIMVFYLFRGKKIWIFVGSALVFVFFVNILELAGLFAFIPIFLYNGERGPRIKYAFYAFYPLHLLVLGGIGYWMYYL